MSRFDAHRWFAREQGDCVYAVCMRVTTLSPSLFLSLSLSLTASRAVFLLFLLFLLHPSGCVETVGWVGVSETELLQISDWEQKSD